MESGITRGNSYATESRITNQSNRGQNVPSEHLLQPTHGGKCQRTQKISEGRDPADEDISGSQATQWMACPYSKLDSNRYSGCLKYALRRPKDVKQHLFRKHLNPEFYCGRCWHIFSDRGGQDQHARIADCIIQPKPPEGSFQGISDEQKGQLKRSGGRGATPEQQWYDVWDILFPGKQKPSSVYLGNFMEETLGYIQNRCRNEDWESMSSILKKTRGDSVNAGLVKDVVTVALNWFHTLVDSTPGSSESGSIDTDTLSQSDTSSSSGSNVDPDPLHEGTLEDPSASEDFSSLVDFDLEMLDYQGACFASVSTLDLPHSQYSHTPFLPSISHYNYT